MNAPVIPDEDLVAYLDGALDPDRERMIDARLETDAVLGARLEAMSLDTDRVRGAFDALLARAPGAPSPIAAASGAGGPRRHLWPMLVAASLAGAIVAGGLNALAPSPPSGWRAYVAAYQVLYVGGTLAHLASDPARQRAELARVSDAIARPVTLDIVSSSDDLEYKRAQILGFEGRPLVQFAFLSRVGAPVALCIIRSEDAEPEALSVGWMEGLSVASWAGGGYAYMLIGGTDARIIEDAARKFAAAI